MHEMLGDADACEGESAVDGAERQDSICRATGGVLSSGQICPRPNLNRATPMTQATEPWSG
jgi:hypothetical protein